MNDKAIPDVSREEVTQICAPFTVKKILELASLLRGEPDDAVLDFKAGTNMFHKSTLTYRRDLAKPELTFVPERGNRWDDIHMALGGGDATDHKVKFETTAEALSYALKMVRDMPGTQILLEFSHSVSAMSEFKSIRDQVAKLDDVRMVSNIMQDFNFSGGGVIRFGSKGNADEGHWDLILKVKRP